MIAKNSVRHEFDGDGDFTPDQVIPVLTTGSISTGDFNADGVVDIVSGFSILVGIGDGTFNSDCTFSTTGIIVFADFNLDGRDDVAMLSNSTDEVFVSLNGGSVDFESFLGDVNRDCELNLLDVAPFIQLLVSGQFQICLLYTSPSPRDLSTSRMPSSA